MAEQHDLPAMRAYQHEMDDYQIRVTGDVRIEIDREVQDWNAVMGEETPQKTRIAQAQEWTSAAEDKALMTDCGISLPLRKPSWEIFRAPKP